jgi:hypothetical protein
MLEKLRIIGSGEGIQCLPDETLHILPGRKCPIRQRNVVNNKGEDYGLTISEGLRFRTMTSGDRNETCGSLGGNGYSMRQLRKPLKIPQSS